MGHGRRRGWKAYDRQQEPSRIGYTYRDGRQPWRSEWRYVPYLRCVQGRQGMKERGEGGKCGGAKRQQKNNYGKPWCTRGKLKEGGGSVVRWACSGTGTIREREDGVGSRHAGAGERDSQVGE